MRDGETTGTSKFGETREGKAEVLGENRTIVVTEGSFMYSFALWDA
jgi:hypothetical protein